MDQKLLYSAPEVEAFLVQFEGVICGSPKYGSSGRAGDNLGLDDDDYNYGGF